MSPVPRAALGAKLDLRVMAPIELPAELETDVVIVGAGAAGLAAANAAAASNATVLVVEAASQVGGTTNKSSGGALITANRFHRESGVAEDRESTIRLMARTSFPELFDLNALNYGLHPRDLALIETFYDSSAPVFEALEAEGVLSLAPQLSLSGDPRGFPSYWTDQPEETLTYGRTITTRTPDGHEGYGRELIRQLLTGAERKGVQVLLEHRVCELLRDGDEVTGVRCEAPDGTRTIAAHRGVVFASGGFTHNRQLMDRHMPGFVPGGGAASTNRGDIVGLTESFGVELRHMDKAWWGEVPAELAIAEPETPMLLFSPYGDSMFYVDLNGRRVVNEKLPYDRRTRAHFARNASGDQPNSLLIMVYDHAVATEPTALFPTRWPVPPPDTNAPWVLRAASLEELEAGLRARVEAIKDETGGAQLSADFGAGLRSTMERFNRFAETGVDEDFDRGREPIEVECSGPRRPGNHPNATMYPIDAEGPYYAILVAAGTLDTKGGPQIDSAGRILRTDGSPVPRLYGAGNCIASPTADSYWSGGATIGPAITFGYLAGAAVSQEEPRSATVQPVIATA